MYRKIEKNINLICVSFFLSTTIKMSTTHEMNIRSAVQFLEWLYENDVFDELDLVILVKQVNEEVSEDDLATLLFDQELFYEWIDVTTKMLSPFDDDEMLEFVREDEKHQENIRKADSFLQALIEDNIIDEAKFDCLMEGIEETNYAELARMVNDPPAFHAWVDDTIKSMEPPTCHYGFGCTNRECEDVHPNGRNIDKPCQDDGRCTRKKCWFLHPKQPGKQ